MNKFGKTIAFIIPATTILNVFTYFEKLPIPEK